MELLACDLDKSIARELILKRDSFFFECRRSGDDLEYRAGVIQLCDRFVLPLGIPGIRLEFLIICGLGRKCFHQFCSLGIVDIGRAVGVIAEIRCHSEYSACFRVHYYTAGTVVRVCFLDALGKCFFKLILDIDVDIEYE